MSARANILARIRANDGKHGHTTEAELAAARAVISARMCGPLPTFARHDPLQHFIEECARLKTTLAEVDSISTVPSEVARYLSTVLDLPKPNIGVVGWPEFTALDWQSANIDYANRPAISAILSASPDVFAPLARPVRCYCSVHATHRKLPLCCRRRTSVW